jgi:hypothetical protein
MAIVIGLMPWLSAHGLILKATDIARLLAAKLTFLSLTLAVGFVQYNYLFQARWTDAWKIRAGEHPTLKAAKEQLEEERKKGRTDEKFKTWEKQRLEYLETAPGEILAQLKAHQVPFFRSGLAFIFALGGCLVGSVLADLFWLISPDDIVKLRVISTATLLVAILMFVLMFIRYLLIARRELIEFHDY